MTLQDDLTSDLSVFFDTDDFAVSCTYTPSGGSASTINVIFDKQFPAQNGNEITFTPAARVKTSDITGIDKNDTMVIDGTTYYVFEPGPDDNGIRTILLSENQA